MKKIIAVLLLVVMQHLTLYAQIPNPSFENWNPTYPGSSYEVPASWGTFTPFFALFTAPANAAKSVDAHTGTYAIKLNTLVFGKDTLSGYALTGDLVLKLKSLTQIKGFALAGRPTTFSGYYKYLPVGNDIGGIVVVFTKYNTVTHKRDSVGSAVAYIPNTTSEYTQFKVPAMYMDNTVVPDSAVVALSSSLDPKKMRVGSELYVDDVAFEGVTANDVAADQLTLTVFPNPATSEVVVQHVTSQAYSLQLRTSTGVILYQELLNGRSEYQFPTSNYASGLYFIEILNADAQVMQRAKISIAK